MAGKPQRNPHDGLLPGQRRLTLRETTGTRATRSRERKSESLTPVLENVISKKKRREEVGDEDAGPGAARTRPFFFDDHRRGTLIRTRPRLGVAQMEAPRAKKRALDVVLQRLKATRENNEQLATGVENPESGKGEMKREENTDEQKGESDEARERERGERDSIEHEETSAIVPTSPTQKYSSTRAVLAEGASRSGDSEDALIIDQSQSPPTCSTRAAGRSRRGDLIARSTRIETMNEASAVERRSQRARKQPKRIAQQETTTFTGSGDKERRRPARLSVGAIDASASPSSDLATSPGRRRGLVRAGEILASPDHAIDEKEEVRGEQVDEGRAMQEPIETDTQSDVKAENAAMTIPATISPRDADVPRGSPVKSLAMQLMKDWTETASGTREIETGMGMQARDEKEGQMEEMGGDRTEEKGPDEQDEDDAELPPCSSHLASSSPSQISSPKSVLSARLYRQYSWLQIANDRIYCSVCRLVYGGTKSRDFIVGFEKNITTSRMQMHDASKDHQAAIQQVNGVIPIVDKTQLPDSRLFIGDGIIGRPKKTRKGPNPVSPGGTPTPRTAVKTPWRGPRVDTPKRVHHDRVAEVLVGREDVLVIDGDLAYCKVCKHFAGDAGAVNKWALGMPVGLVQSFPGHETVRAHRKNLENYYTLVLNQPLPYWHQPKQIGMRELPCTWTGCSKTFRTVDQLAGHLRHVHDVGAGTMAASTASASPRRRQPAVCLPGGVTVTGAGSVKKEEATIPVAQQGIKLESPGSRDASALPQESKDRKVEVKPAKAEEDDDDVLMLSRSEDDASSDDDTDWTSPTRIRCVCVVAPSSSSELVRCALCGMSQHVECLPLTVIRWSRHSPYLCFRCTPQPEEHLDDVDGVLLDYVNGRLPGFGFDQTRARDTVVAVMDRNRQYAEMCGRLIDRLRSTKVRMRQDGSGGESEEKAREEIARVQMEIETSLQQLARRVDDCEHVWMTQVEDESADSAAGEERGEKSDLQLLHKLALLSTIPSNYSNGSHS